MAVSRHLTVTHVFDCRGQLRELAIARVAERVRRGGHAVAEDTVRRRYDRSLFNFFGIYGQFADSWLMVNNSVRPRPRLVAKRAVGRSVRVFRADEWSVLRARYERQGSNES